MRPRAATHDTFRLGAGSLCLDFVATAGSDQADDQLSTPAQLSAWLGAVGLPVPAGGVTTEDLANAQRLRAAIEAVARALIATADPAPADVRTINTHAQHHTPVFLLRPSGRHRTVVEEIDVGGSLSVLARDAVHVFAASELVRLRECARPQCSTVFYDRSPSGRRRWCAMKGCGEIVASASYRQRRAEGGSR